MDTIKELLKKNSQGLSITDITEMSKYSRSTIRTILAKLEGARQVTIQQVGMAKLYRLK